MAWGQGPVCLCADSHSHLVNIKSQFVIVFVENYWTELGKQLRESKCSCTPLGMYEIPSPTPTRANNKINYAVLSRHCGFFDIDLAVIGVIAPVCILVIYDITHLTASYSREW